MHDGFLDKVAHFSQRNVGNMVGFCGARVGAVAEILNRGIMRNGADLKILVAVDSGFRRTIGCRALQLSVGIAPVHRIQRSLSL